MNIPVVTENMIKAAEAVDDLYRMGQPQLWARVFRAMYAAMPVSAEAATPVAWMWQHDETGRIGFVEAFSDDGEKALWQQLNPRLAIVSPLYRAPQASQPIGQLKRPPSKNWNEDAEHENGNYQNTCAQCNGLFIGNKSRVICAQCAFDSQPVVPSLRSETVGGAGIAAKAAVMDKSMEDVLRSKLSINGWSNWLDGNDITLPASWFMDFARALLSASGQAVSEKALELMHETEIALRDTLGIPRSGKETIGQLIQLIRSALSSTPAQQTEAPVNVPHDGEIVAATGSLNDCAVIKWVSDYRPKIGDKLYAEPLAAAPAPVVAKLPQPVQTEAQQEALKTLSVDMDAFLAKWKTCSVAEMGHFAKRLRTLVAFDGVHPAPKSQQSEKDAERMDFVEMTCLLCLDSVTGRIGGNGQKMVAATRTNIDAAIAKEKSK